MCGATDAQTQLQEEQLQAYQSAQQMTQEQYANQQSIYAPMAEQFKSIFAKGPNAEGFSPEEDESLKAGAVDSTAQNYAGAARAVNENLAAEGGGTNTLTTGGEAELKQEVANSSASQESTEENQINQANYQQGYNEWQAAGAGLDAIAAGENPTGYEANATSAGQPQALRQIKSRRKTIAGSTPRWGRREKSAKAGPQGGSSTNGRHYATIYTAGFYAAASRPKQHPVSGCRAGLLGGGGAKRHTLSAARINLAFDATGATGLARSCPTCARRHHVAETRRLAGRY